MRQSINGILLLDKPINMTSNGALQRVKRLFNAKKAGHTGSLDPVATGMLPLCFGEATKFSQFLLDADKSYQVTAQLGVSTTTGDSEGEIICEKPLGDVCTLTIQNVLNQFIGEIEQVPPMYSALKHQGKPLYELARKGIQIERQPRKIKIFSLTFESFENDLLNFSVHCSKGTYIRTLVEDIGNQLGCGGHVRALRRLMVNPYQNAKMHTLSDLTSIAETQGLGALTTCLIPMETSVQSLPTVKLSTDATFYLRMGQAVRTTLPNSTKYVRLMAHDERFLGIGEILEDGRVKPCRLVVN